MRASPGRTTPINVILRNFGALSTITSWFDERRIFVNMMVWRRDILGTAFKVIDTERVTPISLIAW